MHYERNNWGVHYREIVSSDNVDKSKAPPAEGCERAVQHRYRTAILKGHSYQK
jgi:hypothetical protein